MYVCLAPLSELQVEGKSEQNDRRRKLSDTEIREQPQFHIHILNSVCLIQNNEESNGKTTSRYTNL